MTPSTIVAMGGGGFSMEPENLALDQFVLSCASQENPRVVFLPTASGDAEGYIEHFYWAFESLPCRPSHLSLQRREMSDLRSFLLGQEIIYVGGGNSFNMLTLWRAHGVDKILKEAWEKGIVLCGLSAGSVCWFESCLTDSFGPELQAMNDCLGFLKGSHCPHFDSEERRRPTYTRMVQEGKLPPGIAADDGVGLVFHGTDLVETVSSRSTAKAWKVDPSGTATAIDPRLLDPVPRVLPGGA
ncbi:MAG: peptidase E [Planctomycetota bacterium]|nr:peptidase E [Planctomycetota bacterium]